jgi:hypothetical protein
MTRFNRLTPLAILAATALLAGCSNDLGTFTLLSTKHVDLSNFNSSSAGYGTVNGTDHKTLILFGPYQHANMKTACANAEAHVDAIGLTNAKATLDAWSIIGIYGEEEFTVTGTPIRR